MAAKYPGEVAELPTNETNEVKAKDTHPKLHNNANEEINAIEKTLGANPQGPFKTVLDRLGKIKALGEVEGATNLNLIEGNTFTAKLKGATEFIIKEALEGVPIEINLMVETQTFAWSIKNVVWLGTEPVFKPNTRYFITLLLVNGEVIGAAGPGPEGPKGNNGVSYYPWTMNALLGWAFDPISSSSTSAALTSGTTTMTKIMVTPGATLANVLAYVGTKGEGLVNGQCFAGIYSGVTGKLLGKTSDRHVDWETTGLKTMALAAVSEGSLKLAEGVSWVYGALLSNGTVNPKFEGQASQAPKELTEAGLTALLGFRSATLNTVGKTELPTEISLEGVTSQTSERWMAVS